MAGVTDVERWGAVGPVHMIRRENAVFTVTLTRDRDGHAVLDEERFGGQFNLGKEFDDHLARASEEERRKLSEVIAAALDDGRFSSTSYERDAQGRVLTSVLRMGTMDETRSALAYDASGNLVERVGFLRETAAMQHYEIERRTFTYYGK